MRYSLQFKKVYVFTDQHSSCSMRLNDALNMFMSVMFLMLFGRSLHRLLHAYNVNFHVHVYLTASCKNSYTAVSHNVYVLFQCVIDWKQFLHAI